MGFVAIVPAGGTRICRDAIKAGQGQRVGKKGRRGPTAEEARSPEARVKPHGRDVAGKPASTERDYLRPDEVNRLIVAADKHCWNPLRDVVLLRLIYQY